MNKEEDKTISREEFLEKLNSVNWNKVYWYFRCEKCNYGIKKKSAVILSAFFRCPMCNETFSIIRSSYEDYKKCEIRDKW